MSEDPSGTEDERAETPEAGAPSAESAVIPAWWLYHLRGIEILDWNADLDTPLFEDATLVAKSAMVRALEGSERIIAKNGGSVSALRQTLGVWYSHPQEHFSALLAVRRPIVVTDDGPGSMSKIPEVADEGRRLEEEAEQRASDIASVLSLVFMRDVGIVYSSCGLARAVPEAPSDKDGVVDFDYGLFTFTLGGASDSPYLYPGVTQLSRAQLEEKIAGSRFSKLADIVLWPKKERRKKPLARLLARAAERISRSLSVVDYPAKLLEAVIAVEILLSTEEDTKYKVLKQRTLALLGPEVCEALAMDRVIGARNSYVHQGRKPDSELAEQAVRLAAWTLQMFVAVSAEIADKQAIASYLDLRHAVGKTLSGDPGFLKKHLEALPFHPQPRVEKR